MEKTVTIECPNCGRQQTIQVNRMVSCEFCHYLFNFQVFLPKVDIAGPINVPKIEPLHGQDIPPLKTRFPSDGYSGFESGQGRPGDSFPKPLIPLDRYIHTKYKSPGQWDETAGDQKIRSENSSSGLSMFGQVLLIGLAIVIVILFIAFILPKFL